MAATRNRNTPGNYKLEQSAVSNWSGRQMYEHAAQGRPFNTYLAGNGLIQGQMRGNSLLHNPTEVETMLFGIGSTNLTAGDNIDTSKVQPEYKSVDNMNLFATPTVYAPRPLNPSNTNRPSYLN